LLFHFLLFVRAVRLIQDTLLPGLVSGMHWIFQFQGELFIVPFNETLCLTCSYWDFHTLLLYIIHSKVGGRERVITIVFDKSICLLGKWIKLLITILTSSHITQNSMSHLGRSKFLSLIETNCYLKCVGLIIFVFTTFECNVTHSGVSYFLYHEYHNRAWESNLPHLAAWMCVYLYVARAFYCLWRVTLFPSGWHSGYIIIIIRAA